MIKTERQARGAVSRARIGERRAALDAEIIRILSAFDDAGAERIDLPALLPADTLLDLYGEDIRGRAYTTRDPVAGEQMLRPDFTVPVVQFHIESGLTAGRYCYSGPVWRAPQAGSGRAREYLQTGIEFFGDADVVSADADAFVLISRILEGRVGAVATGDMGVLDAVVAHLPTAEHRRDALSRHLWRPARFRQLLDRFGPGHAAISAARDPLLTLLDAGPEAVAEKIAASGKPIGLRSVDDIAERMHRLAAERATPPLSAELVNLTEQVLGVAASMEVALAQLRDFSVALPGITHACDRIEARMEALSRRGVDATALPFATAYGRTNLEYYDGFVFGFFAGTPRDPMPLAQGGRYDRLTAVLGAGSPVPAVGAIIRPEVLVS